jgi:hypothetical protein
MVSLFLEFSVVGSSVTSIIRTSMMLKRIIYFYIASLIDYITHTDFGDCGFPGEKKSVSGERLRAWQTIFVHSYLCGI